MVSTGMGWKLSELTRERAELLGDLERDAAGHAADILGIGELEQRAEQPLDVRLEPLIEPGLHAVARRAGELLVGNDAHPRLEDLFAPELVAPRLLDPGWNVCLGHACHS